MRVCQPHVFRQRRCCSRTLEGWKNRHIPGITKGPQIYGGTAFTSKGAITVGGYQGYKVLLEQILTFFRTGVAPVSKEETIEIFTFMQASNMSKEQNGKIVTLEEAYQKGWKDAQKLIKACNKK